MAAGTVQKRKTAATRKSGAEQAVKRPARGNGGGTAAGGRTVRRAGGGGSARNTRAGSSGTRGGSARNSGPAHSGGARNRSAQNGDARNARRQATPGTAARQQPRVEIKGILLTALGILLMVAFFSEDAIGVVGSAVKLFVFGLFGWPAYFVPSAIIIAGFLMILSNKGGKVFGLTSLYVFMLFAVSAALLHTFYYDPATVRNQSPLLLLPRYYFEARNLNTTGGGGGFFGALLSMPFITLFKTVGARIVLTTLLLIDIILMTNLSLGSFLRFVGQKTGGGIGRLRKAAEMGEDTRKRGGEAGGRAREENRVRGGARARAGDMTPSVAAADYSDDAEAADEAAAGDGDSGDIISNSGGSRDEKPGRGGEASRGGKSNHDKTRMNQEVFFNTLDDITSDDGEAADGGAGEDIVTGRPARGRRIGFSGFDDTDRSDGNADRRDGDDGRRGGDMEYESSDRYDDDAAENAAATRSAADGNSGSFADPDDDVSFFPLMGEQRGVPPDMDTADKIKKPPLRWSDDRQRRGAGEHAHKFFDDESRAAQESGAESHALTSARRMIAARAGNPGFGAGSESRDSRDSDAAMPASRDSNVRPAARDVTDAAGKPAGGAGTRIRRTSSGSGSGWDVLSGVGDRPEATDGEADGGPWREAGAGYSDSVNRSVRSGRRGGGFTDMPNAPVKRSARSERRVHNEHEHGIQKSQGAHNEQRVYNEQSVHSEQRAQNPSAQKQYSLPPLSFLDFSPDSGLNLAKLKTQTQDTAARLEDTLLSFKVRARVINVMRGPAVTQYEVQPDVGVKVNTIVNLAEDISLKLGVSGIRIAPVADRSAIGIEVPNKEVSTVVLRDIITSDAFAAQSSPLAFAVGVDIAGNAIMADIAKMPHLLIAGATGAGKSVCVNCMILSLLYKCSPDEVKLIMVDPKVVELGVYNGIPHLLIPVVTDPRKAAGALAWAVQEMLTRYQTFSEKKAKDLNGYNAHVARTGDGEKLPRIVIIIDELADLMMTAPKEVQDSICRLAQMGRAAGMHLVVATQRPTVDVITGLIKSNIPSRIAFRVASQTDSRVILDIGGAEKLLGRGDMLFYPVGEKKPVRVQGAFISEAEVERVVEHIKVLREDGYDEQMIDTITGAGADSGNGAGDNDDLLPEVIEHVVDAGQASTSMIQRKFKLGYSRAARIIDQMEARGIISGLDGSKPRRVLITRQQLYEMRL